MLEVVGAQTEAHIAAACRRHGLSHAGLNALAVIEGSESVLTPGDIAAEMHMTSGSMTSLLDTLERNGWATRTAHQDDRRKVVVGITPAGQDLLDVVLPEIQVLVRALLRDLSDRQQQTLITLLEKAATSMRAFDGQLPPAPARKRPRRRPSRSD
jgi:DNA-binding MarR family transcriptional regulator